MATRKWAFQQIDPQPARGTLREEMWDSPDWIAETKYDGDRRIAQFCGRVVRFTGRRKSVKDGLFVERTANVPHLSGGPFRHTGRMTATEVATRGPPVELEGTVLDGEMIYTGEGDGGGRSKFVTSVMGSLPEEAIRKQIERGWLRYVVFDCLFYKGKDIRGERLTERRKAVAQALLDWGNPFASMSLAAAPSKRSFYDTIVRRGGEGIILKHIDHRYGDKQGWVKVKKQATADVVIMGFIPAKEVSKKVNGETSMTKYAKLGLIGAVQVGQHMIENGERPRDENLVEVATISGMDDDLRLRMTHQPKKFIGRVVEILHNGAEPSGRFRHPRFNRFRDDKRAEDCVYRDGES